MHKVPHGFRIFTRNLQGGCIPFPPSLLFSPFSLLRQSSGPPFSSFSFSYNLPLSISPSHFLTILSSFFISSLLHQPPLLDLFLLILHSPLIYQNSPIFFLPFILTFSLAAASEKLTTQ